MRTTLLFILALCTISSCSEHALHDKGDFVIAKGQMPNLVKDKSNRLHLVYGSGDSIMYSYSSDNGKSFSQPCLVAVLPFLAASHTRGPQIAATDKSLIVTASDSPGDIFSFRKEGVNWVPGGKVNDVDTTSKEGLMSLSADGETAYAVWLDLRGDKHNKIYGAKSVDGGQTWSKNILVYSSPDSTVCECCKPSVVSKGDKVYVMFRNWLQGNRDLYLVQSTDGGNSFGQAERLGQGNWKLNGCPMDGGGLALNQYSEIQTVWRREKKIYSAAEKMREVEIGEGKGCTLETVNNKNVYAWTENGEIVVLKPGGQKQVIGKGSQPVLKATGSEDVVCLWEHDKAIHASVLQL